MHTWPDPTCQLPTEVIHARIFLPSGGQVGTVILPLQGSRLGHSNSPPPVEQVTVFWKESVPMGEMSQGRCSLSLFKGFCCALRSPRLPHATRGSRKFPQWLSTLRSLFFCKYLFSLKLVNIAKDSTHLSTYILDTHYVIISHTVF